MELKRAEDLKEKEKTTPLSSLTKPTILKK
jgi:hypothetical protein